MPDTIHETEHTIEVAAEPKAVYDLIADVTRWPRMFAPTVHAKVLEQSADGERIQLWAVANGQAKTWVSRRGLDPRGLRVSFRQEVSQPPVAEMGGEWRAEPLPGDGTRVVLAHDYRAVDDAAEHVAWIEQAVDRNSRSELAALKAAAEGFGGGEDGGEDGVAFSFEDTVRINGTIADVYAFLYEAAAWPERLPHVSRLDLTEDTENLQLMSMDTRTADGSVHTTESVRVCFPQRQIIYKQIRTPALMTVHTGQWRLAGTDGDVTASSQHFVVIDPAAVTRVLGAEAGVPEARRFIRQALGTNSGTTLNHAKEFAEKAGKH